MRYRSAMAAGGTYDYQRLTEILESDGRKTVYTYDAFGNRRTETLTNIYDPGASGGSPKAYGSYVYTYAANSNRLTTIQFNGASLESYTYDNAGRLKTRTTSAGTTTYGYDPRGLLTQVVTPSHTITYTYDALGHRKNKTVDGAVTYYVTAPLFGLHHVLMEVDPSKNIQATYVYGGNQQLIEEPIASNRANDLYLVHEGTVGSLTHATDRTGLVKNEYRYAPFGSQTTVTATSSSYQHYGYTGEEQDAETGLVYLRARYYDPSLGRFISADPYLGRLAEPGSQNRYTYVRDNPVMYVDPAGNFAYIWHGDMTFLASMQEGNGLMDSVRYAWQSVMADFKTFNGYPSQAVENANMHGMTQPGQTIDDAMRGNQNFISQQMQLGNLGNAAHAVQDPHSEPHEFKVYNPNNMNWLDWAEHLKGDIFPSWNSIKGAYSHTRNLFKTYNSPEEFFKSNTCPVGK